MDKEYSVKSVRGKHTACVKILEALGGKHNACVEKVLEELGSKRTAYVKKNWMP